MAIIFHHRTGRFHCLLVAVGPDPPGPVQAGIDWTIVTYSPDLTWRSITCDNSLFVGRGNEIQRQEVMSIQTPECKSIQGSVPTVDRMNVFNDRR